MDSAADKLSTRSNTTLPEGYTGRSTLPPERTVEITVATSASNEAAKEGGALTADEGGGTSLGEEGEIGLGADEERGLGEEEERGFGEEEEWALEFGAYALEASAC